MKPIFILISFFVFSACASGKFEKKPPFTITGSTYNYWVGGLPGVKGTRVIIRYETEKSVNFKKIFFAKKSVNIELKKQQEKTYLFGYINTGTKKNEDVILDSDTKQEMDNRLPEKEFPFELKENEAVISYEYKGKERYYKVTNMMQTKTDIYP